MSAGDDTFVWRSVGLLNFMCMDVIAVVVGIVSIVWVIQASVLNRAKFVQVMMIMVVMVIVIMDVIIGNWDVVLIVFISNVVLVDSFFVIIVELVFEEGEYNADSVFYSEPACS